MIIVYHNNNQVLEVYNVDTRSSYSASTLSIADVLITLAKDYPDSLLVWCFIGLKTQLNVLEIEKLFHHKKLLISYNPSSTHFIDRRIGYIEESPFVNINTDISCPTWRMSSLVGVLHTSLLLSVKGKIKQDDDFDYFLNSLAKLCMPLGLLCYSEPLLILKKSKLSTSPKASTFTLFRFVKQHYKARWVFLLFFNLTVYERSIPILPFLCSFVYKNRRKNTIDLKNIGVHSSRKVINRATIDVIIPTIGRKAFLYDVLCDLKTQTHLPVTVIIVEQNPNAESVSELEYLESETWPFAIKHTFTHRTGACNARNIALGQTESEWVFLADDDNRFEANLLEDVFKNIAFYGNKIVTTAYPQIKEIKKYKKVIQWPTFGAGNSFVKRELLENIEFNMAFEFGYGEDADFGMQLRNLGTDVLYLPEPQILHLKAPIGGFRTKPIFNWQEDVIQPKPSPTIMLFHILHHSLEQISGYKTTLFFKYFINQNIKNPVSYYINFQKQWKKSVFWANELKKNQ